MGRSVGIEPTHAGATIQCVNHFTTTAILYFLDLRKYAIAYFPSQVCSNRQLPILPGRLQPSTFGVYVLNYCVRNGNRWVHIAIITGYSSLSFSSIALSFVIQLSQCTSDVHLHRFISSFRALKKKSFAILLKILMYLQHYTETKIFSS